MEFSELNVEYGYAYASAAVVADGSPPPEPIDDIRVNALSTSPGAPLPHAWIDDEDGNRCAIKDLVKPGRFLLIAGENGEAGGRRPAVSSPGRLASRSVRSGSVSATAISTTRAAPGFATARSRATARSSCAPTASSPGGTQLGCYSPRRRSLVRRPRFGSWSRSSRRN